MPSQVDICPKTHVCITDVKFQTTAKIPLTHLSSVRSSLQAPSSLTKMRMLDQAAHGWAWWWTGLCAPSQLFGGDGEVDVHGDSAVGSVGWDTRALGVWQGHG